jgi:hydrogenase expression/formation protein HypC
MCLGVPGKVLVVSGMSATVDFFGVTRELRLDIVDQPVQPGDYVLNHVGFAIRRIPPEEVQETLALFDAILEDAAREDDLMAADVRGEIAAGTTGGGQAGADDGGGGLRPPTGGGEAGADDRRGKPRG